MPTVVGGKRKLAFILKLYWLLPSFLGFFLLSSPAEAARLLFWRYDANQNRLVFTTDVGVQPRAQLIVNPTRLIIDLPGIILESSAGEQLVGGAIRSVRVGQIDFPNDAIGGGIKPWVYNQPPTNTIPGSLPQPVDGATTNAGTVGTVALSDTSTATESLPTACHRLSASRLSWRS
jgi:hypothetical protein